MVNDYLLPEEYNLGDKQDNFSWEQSNSYMLLEDQNIGK